MSSGLEKYSGKVTPVGKSKGIRLDAAFFRAHPEFKGTVRATVVADGQVLLSARSPGRKAKSDETEDPVLLGFLRFLEAQMGLQPEYITAADPTQLARIAKLVSGVKTVQPRGSARRDRAPSAGVPQVGLKRQTEP